MSTMASQITGASIVYSTVCSGADQRKHQNTALAFGMGIHWWPVNSPHKGPVTRKNFPFDDVIMKGQQCGKRFHVTLSSCHRFMTNEFDNENLGNPHWETGMKWIHLSIPSEQHFMDIKPFIWTNVLSWNMSNVRKLLFRKHSSKI